MLCPVVLVKNMIRTLLCIAFILCWSSQVYAQSEATPFQSLALNNLGDFQSTTDNWQILGRITADRDEKWAIDTESGTGILANIQTDEARGHLFTSWDHADIELDLEVMVPNGSNSGIYFQSRYEIQILDSWGAPEPQMSHLGGIYQRWDESRPEGERGYEGHAPRLNVSRAPGLWQHLNVVFQAPRFDASGNKTAPAKFVRVTLNGIVIHEDVSLTGPTRAAAYEDDEVAMAPLMIQGDHGPVAFRNIKYRKFDAAPVSLSNLSYNYYRGDFPHQMPDLGELNLVRTESTEDISAQKADTTKLFALRFEGNLEVPRSGVYTFEVVHSARFGLEINGEEILSDRSAEDVSRVGEFPRRMVQKRLSKGMHAFALIYAKGLWHNVPTALGWYVSGPGLLRTQLTASGSVPADAFSAYQVDVNQEPFVQRNFVVHKDEKRTHAISVGFPGGLHYAYDMATGSILHLWKGQFVDTSTMWYQRGNMQSAVPLGSLITRSGKQAIYVGNPSATEEQALDFKNYRLNQDGQPAFSYEIAGLTVTDEITPSAENTFFTRSLTFSGNASGEEVWYMLAESDKIEAVGGGRYAIDDQRMYIEVDESLAPRLEDDATRLLVPVNLADDKAALSYKLVW